MVVIALQDLSLLPVMKLAVSRPRRYAERERKLELFADGAVADGPKAVILDVKFGGNDWRAIEAVPLILNRLPTVAVIILTEHPTIAEVAEMEELGACGFVDRQDPQLIEKLAGLVSVARRTELPSEAELRKSTRH